MIVVAPHYTGKADDGMRISLRNKLLGREELENEPSLISDDVQSFI